MLLFSCPLVGPNMLASADERRYFIGRQYRCLEAGVLVSLRWGQNEAPGVPGGLKASPERWIIQARGWFPSRADAFRLIRPKGRGKSEHTAVEVNLKSKSNQGPKGVNETD